MITGRPGHPFRYCRKDLRELQTEELRRYAVSQVVGFIKGKSAIHVARVYGERKQNYAGQNFWARGYFVSTVGRDDSGVHTQSGDGRSALEQMNMWK